MSTSQLKKQAKHVIDGLSDAQLRVATEFLAFVQTRELDPATLELLSVPGFKGSFERGVREVKAGKTRPWREVKAKV